MRCLYCGKELAFLKRWTGGGEFCSDAHRQQYQEEYNKLALSRLLQAQPSGEQKPAEKPPEKVKETKPEPVVSKSKPDSKPEVKPAPRPEPIPEPVVARAPEPIVAVAEPPVEEEEEVPAEVTGFFVELPIPATATTRAIAAPEYDLVRTFTPALPGINGHGRTFEGELRQARQVVLEPSGKFADYEAAQAEKRLEVREFVRSAPKVGFDLGAAGIAGLLDKSEEPMDILIFPHPPQGSPPLRSEAEREFKFDIQLGSLALVPFGTTGIEDNLDDLTVKREPLAVSAVEAKVEAPPAPVIEKATPVLEKTVVEKPVERPAPAVAAPKIERASKPLFVPAAAKPVQKVAEKPAAATPVPEKKSEPIPQLVTKPLPVTLHGLAAGRGKPVQVFTTPATAGIELQIPRSNALPLRPAMSVGPIVTEEKRVEEKKIEKQEEKRTVIIKPEPKRPQNGRPDTRFSNGKGRKFEPEKPEPAKPEAPRKEEKVAVAVASAVRETPVERKPEPERKPAQEIKPAAAVIREPEPLKQPVKESPKPAPLAAPYTTPDLGLPSLAMESSQGFWSKLPMAAKAAAILVLVLGISAVVLLGGKNHSAAAGSGEVVEAGTPLAVVDSGWITDWGAEPGVRKVHEISVLRPSLALSDYRLEFQAQIENKALGWVYRAKDGKNYYVNRLEIVKPGLDPTIALVRFAVINGEEQPRAQFPLSLPVHVDTLYKIRFDAVGDRFTTWVQGQKIDEWTDSRLKMGGVGLYNERGERMSMKGGLNVVPLAIRR